VTTNALHISRDLDECIIAKALIESRGGPERQVVTA
jgi:hypothetical protein